MSTQWNRQLNKYVSKVIECLEQKFENKSIAKDHQILNIWTDYKIFELKHGDSKLWGNKNHELVKLVLAVFSFCLFVPI